MDKIFISQLIRYDGFNNSFELVDEINVRVTFRVDAKIKRSYASDLEP
ncbi:hypothetical protein [Methanobrevibacter sp.]